MEESVGDFFTGSSVLITGGTGSFGQAFAKYLLKQTDVARVIIFSRDEWKQWQMRHSDPIFTHPNIRFFLGDVRDLSRLKLALKDVQFVVHAAALKQVPAAEYNPTEFINTNVTGAMNLTAAALESDVRHVIALSTDKAVNPLNLYGATKLCSDKLFIAANSYVGKQSFPRFSVVRYGNVLGSRGSLIPLWTAQAQQGASQLPITDMTMTRFWISLQQAVEFVVMALKQQTGGEIFVPKSPSVKISDLAQALFPSLELEVTGIRPGEKLHEVLISQDDARNTYEFDTHYRIIPPYPYQRTPEITRVLEQAQRVASDFSLCSDNNPRLLHSIQEIRELIS